MSVMNTNSGSFDLEIASISQCVAGRARALWLPERIAGGHRLRRQQERLALDCGVDFNWLSPRRSPPPKGEDEASLLSAFIASLLRNAAQGTISVTLLVLLRLDASSHGLSICNCIRELIPDGAVRGLL